MAHKQSFDRKEQTSIELVTKIVDLASNAAGQENLRELFAAVAGAEEISLTPPPDTADNQQIARSVKAVKNKKTEDKSETLIVRRSTTQAEREDWLILLAGLETHYSPLATNKKAFRAGNPKIAAGLDFQSELDFIIEETASIILSLFDLTGDGSQITKENTVVVRLSGLLVHHFDVLTDTLGKLPGAKSGKTTLPKMTSIGMDGWLRSPANRLNQASIEAFMPGALKRGEDASEILSKFEAQGLFEKYFAVYPVTTKRNDLYGIGGFRNDPGEVLWETLQKKGDLAIRAQFALWSRAYLETNAEPGQMIKISINQFCDDVGFRRNKGAHKRENKRTAIEILELLTSFEMSVMWQKPDGKGKWSKVRGPIWMRGALGEEFDEYEDLFGSNRIGNPGNWEPVAFAYAPGFLFENREWRDYNRAVALVGQGLLTLTADNRDKWAVLIGGYLALQSRFNDYRPKRIRLKTLLEKTGLQEQMRHDHAARTIDRIEIALDRLRQVGVIADWKYTDEEPEDEVDLNDVDSLQTRQAIAEKTKKRRLVRHELNRVIEIKWTVQLDGEVKLNLKS